jgi:hypothetical protein
MEKQTGKSAEMDRIASHLHVEQHDVKVGHLADLVICKVREPVVTGKSHKMRLSGVMKAFESAWHEDQFSEKLAV